MPPPIEYSVTPDGRYFVVRGRLWRLSDPSLSAEMREKLVRDLMSARRAIATAHRRGDRAAELTARRAVGEIKVAFGERGPVWWSDGASDLNRRLARNTPYADWYTALGAENEPMSPLRTKSCAMAESCEDP